MIRALDAMRNGQLGMDLHRVGAIQFVDAALGADRRQLIKQYMENAEGSPKLADRIWQALWELAQAFMLVYQAALERALTPGANARWKSVLPLLFVRLVHFHGTDAKLRVFKYERWIPAKWIELHQIYLRACELGCDRRPVPARPGARDRATARPDSGCDGQKARACGTACRHWHRLPRGRRAARFARPCARAAAAAPEIPCRAGRGRESLEGFFVDLAGRTGLIRRNGNDRGSVLRYLDTTPLTDAMGRAVDALREAEATDQGPIAAINQQRLAVLRKIQPAISPSALNDLRRDPRTSVAVSARVRIGLPRICQDLTAKAAGEATPDVGGEQIEVFPVAGAPRVRRKTPVEDDTLAASLSSWNDPTWEVKDRSVAGLRIAATGGIGQSLTLGALVAVRQSDADLWLLGVVRRLNKLSRPASTSSQSAWSR